MAMTQQQLLSSADTTDQEFDLLRFRSYKLPDFLTAMLAGTVQQTTLLDQQQRFTQKFTRNGVRLDQIGSDYGGSL